MSQPTPEQIAKLPKWAQHHITWLRREHAALNRQVEQMGGKEPTAIELDPYRDSMQAATPQGRVYLPERITIRYRLDGGEINVSLRRGRLDINSTRVGDGFMEIQPSASNAFTVGFGGNAKHD